MSSTGTLSMQAATDSRQIWLRAATIQLVSLVLATAVSYWLNWSLGNWLLIIAVLSGAFSYQSELPRWLVPVQVLFIPLVFYVYQQALPSWIYLLAFLLMYAVYGRVFSSRVPLYLSGEHTCNALAELMPTEKLFRFLDLGAGTGRVLRNLDKKFPFGMFHGVEIALLPFLIAWLGARIGKAQYQVRYQNMWRTNLAEYDVVYAFLSPQPMTELWQKVKREMKPGSLFISNSFSVPDVQPDQVINLDDGRNTALYVWKL